MKFNIAVKETTGFTLLTLSGVHRKSCIRYISNNELLNIVGFFPTEFDVSVKKQAFVVLKDGIITE